MATGKILRFDDIRGYGFITPDDGDEDVFMHANDLRNDKALFRPGLRVAFEVEDGQRGLKASDVRLIERAAPTTSLSADVARPRLRTEAAEDGTCDVLTAGEFQLELTEALLHAVPSLTGTQLLLARKRLIELAQEHNWVE
ncbi:cold-shock protein [Streptomyces zagrosensis]|uniref:Cold shock CspA family protein n=1 Tax=Streptomyces zagrosensis TaxID=1042984 RepID=A0A7W9V1M7_9ACTN|nr:cold shock domain-containing protein [Streptomyces zagrosensis]MBB5937949.1 cold shock CspA family protein [Streptomyces zagrosensis]